VTPFEEIVGLRALLELAGRDAEVARLFDVERAWRRFEGLVGTLLGAEMVGATELDDLERMWARS
jgi:hypothetical protein